VAGEAVVNVSVVNWVKNPTKSDKRFLLDGEDVAAIGAALRSEQRKSVVVALPANLNRSFQGVTPSGSGFVLSEIEAEDFFRRTAGRESDVVRYYLDGADIADDPAQRPRRCIIDFALLPLETAKSYPTALRLVEERVRHIRERNNREVYRRYWWRFAEPRPAMRAAIKPLSRFIVCNRYGKRILMTWAAPDVLPSGQVIAFAFADDYSFGVLASRVHAGWAWAQSSTLRVDIRYTPTSAFDTFPWPDPISNAQREAIAELARKIVARRQEICLERQFGLTRLYNEVDDGAYTDIAALHRKLDESVCAAYGWPRSIAGNPDETNARLLALNQEIVAGKRPYNPFAFLRV
jgi:hypothetical protein